MPHRPQVVCSRIKWASPIDGFGYPATNRLTGNNALYDSVGNLLRYGVGTPEQYYTYDVENRVMQVTANGATTAYGYDTRNQRI